MPDIDTLETAVAELRREQASRASGKPPGLVALSTAEIDLLLDAIDMLRANAATHAERGVGS